MFVELPRKVGTFLASLQFAGNCPHPFSHLQGQSPKATIFSELDLGTEGFGKPDGAIYVECPEPTLLLIEVKLNETYAQSCKITKDNEYNSTIKGQLELRWRFSHLNTTTPRHVHDGNDYVRESPELKSIYSDRDRFYAAAGRQDEQWLGSWRRLKVADGVKDFLSFSDRCEGRVFFCAITCDTENPFDTCDFSQMPRCGAMEWETAKTHFCWLPASVLTGATTNEV